MKKIVVISLLVTILFLPTYVSAETVIGNKSGSPIGTIVAFTGDSIPSGYVEANGASVLRTDYPDLFSVIGTTYGSADSTHFNLPNLKGRVVVGIDGSDTSFDKLGEIGGAKTVTLTSSQLPAHTHTYSGTTSSSGAHTHSFGAGGSALVVSASSSSSTMPLAYGFTNESGSGWFSNVNKNTSDIASSGAHTHTYSGTTSSVGSGGAHNNLQPYITLKYIIKVK